MQAATRRLECKKSTAPSRNLQVAYQPRAISAIRSAARLHASSTRTPFERVVVTRAQTEDSPAPATVDTTPAPSSTHSSTPGGQLDPNEKVFYEGPGSNAELIISLLLAPTLFYTPLSIASLGRRLWISFRFTNKRLMVINTSPLFKRTIEVSYKDIKEIRTGPRAFGLWGDMVVFLRDGSRLELTGLEKYREIAEHIDRCIYTL